MHKKGASIVSQTEKEKTEILCKEKHKQVIWKNWCNPFNVPYTEWQTIQNDPVTCNAAKKPIHQEHPTRSSSTEHVVKKKRRERSMCNNYGFQIP